MHVLFIIIFASVSAMAQGVADDIWDAFHDQDYDTAIVLSKNCYDLDTSNIECLNILAKAYNKSGDQANAKTTLHKLEAKDSPNVDIYIQLATIYEQQLQLPKAIKYYTKVNKLQPEVGLYFRKNANIYKSYKDYHKAAELYEKAVQINPKDIVSIHGLSEMHIQLDRFSAADSILQIGLDLDSTNISINYLIARSKYKQRQFESVVEVFDRIRGQVDLNSYYSKMLGYAYLQIDSIDLAVSKLQLALVDDESSEKLHFYLATAFEKLGNVDGAMVHYEKAVEHAVSPDLDLYHRHVGRVANDNNDLKKAIAAYKDAYKYGDDPVMLYYLATASDKYYKDKAIAINYYNRYLTTDHRQQEYKQYAKERSRYLKEINHQRKGK